MPLARLHAPFDHPDWLYELKYDGFRALACEAILDGEIAHLDAEGRRQFYNLLRRRSPQYFLAFDLLWLGGRDLRMLPLVERKRGLARLLRSASPAWREDHVKAPVPLIYADHVEGNGSRTAATIRLARKW